MNIDELEALASAATPGPWEAGEPNNWGDDDDIPQSGVMVNGTPITWDDHSGDVFNPADAEFIAAARTAVPELIAEVRRLRDVVEQQKKAIIGRDMDMIGRLRR